MKHLDKPAAPRPKVKLDVRREAVRTWIEHRKKGRTSRSAARMAGYTERSLIKWARDMGTNTDTIQRRPPSPRRSTYLTPCGEWDWVAAFCRTKPLKN